MKTSALIILLSFLYLFTQAQDCAIIKDKDGFVNVRKEANSKSEIIWKLYNKDIFSYDSESETNSKWVKIYKQQSNNNLLEGYVYENRTYLISKFPSLNIKNQDINICSLKNDSISVIVQSSKFNSKIHRLSFNSDHSFIDGKPFWGTDETIPHLRISSVKVVINGKKIGIPNNAFDDLYEPNYRNFNVYLGINGVIYIEMDNSDGAGAYTVIWIIKDGKYFDRYIDNLNV
jgi:hypothetical protein